MCERLDSSTRIALISFSFLSSLSLSFASNAVSFIESVSIAEILLLFAIVNQAGASSMFVISENASGFVSEWSATESAEPVFMSRFSL